jgi:glycosyltransferase involved in cell wall biosynthesis
MRIAFYAPMKAPTDPVPSGDRHMARLLMAALRLAGHEVTLASKFKSRDGAGDAAVQVDLQKRGLAAAKRLVARYRALPEAQRPQAWLTYHLYHRAPDWLGPAVCDALAIPYLAAEASFAPKQAGGKWALGHDAVEAALRRADGVIHLNSRDAVCVEPLLKPGAVSVSIRPFLETVPFATAAASRARHREALCARFGIEPATPILLAVGMMRHGDKLESYRVLGRALARVVGRPWRLVVAGEGPAEAEVRAALSPLGARVAYAGFVSEKDLPALYAGADLYVWPAIREAYGMAILEAQSSGVAVVAGAAGGVPDIVREGNTGLVTAEGNEDAFIAAVTALLDDPNRRKEMGLRALALAAGEHTLAAAARALHNALARVCGTVVAAP